MSQTELSGCESPEPVQIPVVVSRGGLKFIYYFMGHILSQLGHLGFENVDFDVTNLLTKLANQRKLDGKFPPCFQKERNKGGILHNDVLFAQKGAKQGGELSIRGGIVHPVSSDAV